MERDRRDDPDDEGFRVGFVTSLPMGEAQPVAERAAPPRRLEPRPDKGLPFAEALDETMRDHRAVFAALAK